LVVSTTGRHLVEKGGGRPLFHGERVDFLDSTEGDKDPKRPTTERPLIVFPAVRGGGSHRKIRYAFYVR